jgi:hypothetical protein
MPNLLNHAQFGPSNGLSEMRPILFNRKPISVSLILMPSDLACDVLNPDQIHVCA